MLNFYFIRHGQTQWNSEKKLQGRTNIPLNEQGIAQIQAYNLPERLQSLQWYSSPLLRARETADLLGINALSENQLIEMNWGDWEGKTLQQVQADDPLNFAQQEAKGLDLLPCHGESPRMVGTRMTQWAEQLIDMNANQNIGCVSHKGVIRAVYAMAAQWPMLKKAPHKLDFHCAQHICFSQGKWQLGELNIALK
ncbi:MAG: putative phosphoglycerate mutase [Oceanospirillaceae bacterium]|jgi:probable phosphoglycerate mutase